MTISFSRTIVACLAFAVCGIAVAAEPVVPGAGRRVEDVGDDFEDPDWEFIFRLPKSSKNLNKNDGGGGGESKNDHWYEGVKRGQPDIIKTVPTPPNGLANSTRSLLLRSVQTGIPGRPSYRLQQDDFIANVHYRNGSIPVSQTPSAVVRIFMPKVEEWEDRSGPSFAFRVAVETSVRKRSGAFGAVRTQSETYWPGFFIEFDSKTENDRGYDSAHLRIRANSNGADFTGPAIKQTGWWTFGISCTPDGMLHYYASPGVDDLTDEDYITSQFPYGHRAQRFKTYFFNVCNGDDGRTWSTPWIIDDPKVFIR
ncbi:MAG: hypothetical protein QGG36_13945 [Pirellulaceae bacterium]|jgi:hypothetical protein|nr:hypothetical protein [Pirellulaceae bacterium]MDP7016901.1 hypothetical protein [Pirellulaceae bacterium]